MDSAKAGLLESLKQAIEAEIEGQHFYRMAAATTSDDKGREVFEALASEEFRHAEYLKAQYRTVLETGSTDLTLALGGPKRLADPYPIFSEDIRGRIRDSHYEMTALSVGIQLEESAIRFYKSKASETRDDNARRFFLELADWEMGHYSALLRQQELLREDYWADNQFSQF